LSYQEIPRDGQGGKAGRDISPRLIITIILVALAVIFILLNSKHTKVNFGVFHAETPIFLVIVISLAIGFVVGYLIARGRAKAK
jgi:uncharacterized integral membrane protein